MYSKIMIFGLPGSGKSTFSLKFSRILHLPLYHLDRYFFVEDWKERDPQEFLEIQKELVQKKTWIIEGNAIKSLEIRFSKADLVLYFNFNRFLCLWRIFKRLFFKDYELLDRCEGCSEKVRFRLIRYLWNFNQRVKSSLEDLKKKYPHVEFHEFHTSKDVGNFIHQF